ncbi:MAG: von Willebrand factor type A domain-containing protein [Clostridiales bacterium]|nr:von Willebrand factor type A domain-containing protein [Clostridiales bacterium]
MKKNRIAALAAVLALFMALAVTSAAETRILKKGDTGEDVLSLETRLAELRYFDGTPDEVFDTETESALMSFQARNNLLETGMTDAKTWERLFSDEARPAAEKKESGSLFDWFAETEEVYESGAVIDSYAAPLMARNAMPMATGMPKSLSMSAGTAGFGYETWNTNEYTTIRENGFESVSTAPLSTFAADVDTASYAQLRALILAGKPVPRDAVRIEEMLNYFSYNYKGPEGNDPFGVTMELAKCPWREETLLLQVGLQAVAVPEEERPRHNFVFLIDVSGSMFGVDRLDLVKRAFMLLLEELQPTDTVSIVTYASRDEVVLEGVPAADKVRIMEAVSNLEAGGSTNSAAGIQTAYAIAEKYAAKGSVNRILMATDGDFNVGMTSEGDLARLVMEKKENGVKLTMLGVGYGNYKDNKLEALADYGDGNYYYLDSIFEARRALVSEAGGTFIEVARDVKLQLDFNPAKIAGYRLIGYEDRVMAAADFADDSKDGGELGSGHRVTALYEIVPVGSGFDFGVAESKYAKATSEGNSKEWLTLSVRAKRPGNDASELWTYPLAGEPEEALSDNMKFAAAVAEAGMLLRDSGNKGDATFESALALARDSGSVTGDPYKEEFVYLLTLLERAESMK